MSDLVQFLRARLQDDEDYARNAFADHNDAGPNWYEQWSGALNIGEEEDLVLTNDSAISRFMERHDPARILAEVEVDRLLLTEYVRLKFDVMPDDMTGVFVLERIISAKAAVRAGHPDYREEWKP